MKISSIANYYLTNLENRPTDFVPEIVTYFAYQAAKKGSFDLLLHLKSKLFYNHNFQNISISDNDKIYALLLPDHRSVLKQEEVFGEHKQQLTCVLHLFSKDKREQVVKVFEAINSVNLALKLEDKETLLKMLRFSNNTTDISELINYIQTTKEINLESILKKTVIMNHFSHLDNAE